MGRSSIGAVAVSSFPVPDILIVHVGGNDVGKVHTLVLMEEMKKAFLLLKRSLSFFQKLFLGCFGVTLSLPT